MIRMLFPGTTVRDVLNRSSSALMVAAMVLSAAAPLLLKGNASAAQVTERKITISTSVISATSVTYSVSFRPATDAAPATGTDDIKGIVVDFCQDTPLLGTVCGKTNGVSGIQTSGTVAVAHTGATGTPVNFTAQDPTGATMDGSALVLTDATGLDEITAANPITFSFTATNPSGTASTAGAVGTFYARIITYNSTAAAAAYDSSSTGSANPGTHLDDGGIALSTARQLTVNAKVQEELEFCVGALPSTVVDGATATTELANGGTNCSSASFSGTTPTVDIGVVSSSGVSVSPALVTAGGNEKNGGILIHTNAANGASITYFAEQNSSSGRLKVAGASCSAIGAGAYDAGSNSVDQCFNSNGSEADTGNNFRTTVTGEKFGMTAGKVLYPTGTTTTNVTRSTDYDGNGTVDNSGPCVPATIDSVNCFAWNSAGTTTTLATSSTVIDYELLVLNFAARAAPTTPTGFYAVTSTYVATPTF